MKRDVARPPTLMTPVPSVGFWLVERSRSETTPTKQLQHWADRRFPFREWRVGYAVAQAFVACLLVGHSVHWPRIHTDETRTRDFTLPPGGSGYQAGGGCARQSGGGVKLFSMIHSADCPWLNPSSRLHGGLGSTPADGSSLAQPLLVTPTKPGAALRLVELAGVCPRLTSFATPWLK